MRQNNFIMTTKTKATTGGYKFTDMAHDLNLSEKQIVDQVVGLVKAFRLEFPIVRAILNMDTQKSASMSQQSKQSVPVRARRFRRRSRKSSKSSSDNVVKREPSLNKPPKKESNKSVLAKTVEKPVKKQAQKSDEPAKVNVVKEQVVKEKSPVTKRYDEPDIINGVGCQGSSEKEIQSSKLDKPAVDDVLRYNVDDLLTIRDTITEEESLMEDLMAKEEENRSSPEDENKIFLSKRAELAVKAEILAEAEPFRMPSKPLRSIVRQ